MDSSQLPRSELQPPDEPESILRTFDGYRAALAQMTIPQQLEQLTRINAALEIESHSRLTQTILDPLSEFMSSLDQIVPRSRAAGIRSPSPRDRGAAASRPTSSLPQSPLDLLFGSRGRRLAGKLVAAQARSINGNRRR